MPRTLIAAAALMGGSMLSADAHAQPRVARTVAPDARMGDGFELTAPSAPQGATTCNDGSTLFGIDVSEWQGDVDWSSVASDGVTFSFVRVSDGLGYVDDWFDSNWAESRAEGIYTGAYQFFRADQDPVAQAQLLLDMMGPLGPDDLPPVIDVETSEGLTPAQLVASITAWVDHVEAELGVQPIIYTGKYVWQDYVLTDAFAGYPLWIAHYTDGCPNIPDQWDDWVFHQYCDCGTVAGVAGPTDVNYFNGDLAALQALAGSGASCGDAVCSASESHDSCPSDCEPCGVIGVEGQTFDNGHACYELFGDGQYWREEPVGHGGDLLWTYATDYGQAFNYAVWRLVFESAGDYLVEAHISADADLSQQAAYEIIHGDGEQTVIVDQTATSGWTELGTLYFEAGGQQSIRLTDDTGEPVDAQRRIVFDALRITPVAVSGGSESGADETGNADAGQTTGADADTDAGDGTSGGAGNDEPGGTGGTGGAGGNADGDGDGGQSSCSVRAGTGDIPFSPLMLMLLVGAGLRRRAGGERA